MIQREETIEHIVRALAADVTELELVKQVIERHYERRWGVTIDQHIPRSIYSIMERGFLHDERFNTYHEALEWVLRQDWPIKCKDEFYLDSSKDANGKVIR